MAKGRLSAMFSHLQFGKKEGIVESRFLSVCIKYFKEVF